MAFYDMTHTATTGRLRRSVGSFFADFNAWREGIATRNALSRLTDHELQDIGLNRSDIDQMSDAELRNT